MITKQFEATIINSDTKQQSKLIAGSREQIIEYVEEGGHKLIGDIVEIWPKVVEWDIDPAKACDVQSGECEACQ